MFAACVPPLVGFLTPVAVGAAAVYLATKEEREAIRADRRRIEELERRA